MNAWMIGMGYAGGLLACSVWAHEWARRKGLNARAWGMAGATTGPLAVAAVGLWRAQGTLCPHCMQPMRFEQRYCPTCRTYSVAEVPDLPGREAAPAEADVIFPHSYFEPAAA